jgi:hypothetical protein
MFRKITVLGLFATSALALAVPDAHAVWINGKWYAKGVEEDGKVWYDTVFAGITPPELHTRVFGINCPNYPNCQGLTGDLVFGALTCVKKFCLTDPDRNDCIVPGNAQGTPYQVSEDDFFLQVQETTCAVKGQKGTCKVLNFNHILNADLTDTHACPGGFVPDFIPDPFVGRTSTCDVSQGTLNHDANNKPYCQKPGEQPTAATVLCQFVANRGATVGDPYAIQVEIPENGGTILTATEYFELGCTPNVFR